MVGQSQEPQPLKESSSSLQAVIFDIDGTLVNSWKLCFDATQVVLRNNKIDTITQEMYHECTKYSTPHRLAIHAGLSMDEKEFDTVGKRLAQEFDDLYVGLVTTETAGFFPGIARVLQSVMMGTLSRSDGAASSSSPIKLACLTNACVAYAHAVLTVNSKEHKDILSVDGEDGNSSDNDMLLYERFESIHGADTVPAPKPQPDGLYQICKELDVSPRNAVYVGDSPSDALAADAAGMPSIGVTWGSHPEDSLRKAPFTYVVSTVDELLSTLRNW
jgi:phosphoglycolate phosphatase-like HAD superfamily hydrolase